METRLNKATEWRKSSKFSIVVQASFGNLGLGQRLPLESFQLSLVATFLIGFPSLRHSSARFKKLNHSQKREQQNKNFQRILWIITSNFTKFQNIFHCSQVKQNLILSLRNLIYQLPNDMPNNLRLRILEKKKKISAKLQNCMETQSNVQSQVNTNFQHKLSKKDIKVFQSCFFFTQNLLNFSIFPHIFRRGLQMLQNIESVTNFNMKTSFDQNEQDLAVYHS